MKQKRQTQLRKRNGWKVAFITLISLIVLSIIGCFIAVELSSTDRISNRKVASSGAQEVSVEMNKAQLNNLSQYYLNKLQTQNNGRVNYHFEVADQGAVYGSIKLLGTDVDYAMFFKPEVLANGNVALHATKMSLGRFPLPISFVLMNIQHAYKLPKWVELLPNKKVIKLDIAHMNGRSGINYQAKQINLSGKGKFLFKIILPKATKGD